MPALNNLFILDLANNHNGDPEHAARIIEEIVRQTNLACRTSQHVSLCHQVPVPEPA